MKPRKWRPVGAVLLLICFELTGIFPNSSPQAQPVAIPALSTPAFNQTDFDPYFTTAREVRSIPAWETLINQAGILLGAQWEIQADAQIAAELASLNQTDAFNSPTEYRDYLRRELQVQKQNAFANWELQAMAAIEAERGTFLAGLSTLDPSQILDDSDRAIQIGRSDAAQGEENATDVDSFESLLESVNDQQANWRDQFGEDYQAGLYQYSQALAGIQQNYNEFVQSLTQKDQEFQSSLAQIEAYENNVRTGIGARLTAMENSLQTNGLFHGETCDTENVCTLDSSTLNTSGTQLQALITSMRTGLQNGASLPALSNQMITYLQAGRQQAEADRQNWATLTSATESISPFGVGLQGQGRNAHLVIPQLGALASYYNGNASFMNTMVRQLSAQPAYRTVTINSADGYGYTPPGLLPILIPFFSQVGGVSERYSAAREGAFAYVYVENDPFNIGSGNTSTTTISESEFIFEITYTWHDSNAQSNQDRWAGYVNDLDAMLAQWENTILPAANTWEAQKQQYNANYQAWQTQAQAQQATAQATSEQNRDLVITARNQFISTTASEFRKGQNTWREIEKDVTAARNAAGDLNVTGNNIIDRINAIGSAPGVGKNLSEILRNLGTLPQPSSEFLNLSRAELPDLQNLSVVGNGLSNSLNGASNYSLTSATQENFERERSKVRKMLTKMLETSRLANTSSGDIAVTLLMQRLEPQHLAQLQGMQQKDLVRHINSTLGLAADGDLTVSAVERFAQMHGVEFEKPINELVTARRTDADNAIWSVQEVSGGKLRATRQIKDGNAFLRFGADGTKDESYIAGEQEQVLEFAAPAVMKLADTDGLFEQWETKTILTNFSEQLDQFAGYSKEQQAAVWNTGSKADAYRGAKERQFNQNVQQQTFIASIIKAALTSALTGGNAIEGASGVVRSRIMGPIYSALETATGIPAGIWGSLAGGASIEQAVISQGFSVLEEMSGVPGLASMLQTEWGKMQARQARREAQRFRAEDMIPLGPVSYGFSQLAYSSNPLVANYGRAMAGATSLTYAWRNAQHHNDGAIALQAVETVGAAVIQTAGVFIPGLGTASATAIIAGYQAAKQGYLGSLNGGTRGALTGIASGAINGVVSHYSGGMANVGFSYSYEDGFGVSANASIPILGSADTGALSLGVGGTWNEHEGITGTSASLGFTNSLGPNGDGPSLFAGVKYNSETGVNAAAGIQSSNDVGSAAVGVTYAPDVGYSAAINFGIDNESMPGLLNGGGGTLSYNERNGITVSYSSSEDSVDQFELSWNQNDGLQAELSGLGGKIEYGPGGLSIKPDYDFLAGTLGIDPNIQVAGFDLGYDFDKGFSAVLPGDDKDVLAYNEQDGVSSPWFDDLEKQAQDQIDEIKNLGNIGEQIEAIVGVVQNPGDYMDLDPFGGENPLDNLPDLSGIFGEEGGDGITMPDGENGNGEEVAGGPDPDGEENGGEGGSIAGGGSPDGEEVVGHRGGDGYSLGRFKISSVSIQRAEELKNKFEIKPEEFTKAEQSLAKCEAISTGGEATEESLIAQVQCFAAISGPPEVQRESGLSVERLGAQSYSDDFLQFVHLNANEAKAAECTRAGKGPEDCTLHRTSLVPINDIRDSDARIALAAEADQIQKIQAVVAAREGTTAPKKEQKVWVWRDQRGNQGRKDSTNRPAEGHVNEWLSTSEIGKQYIEYNQIAGRADLLKRQAEKRLFALSYKEEADKAILATDLGGLKETEKADREVGLIQGFAEEAYQYAVQLKNSVTEFTAGLIGDVKDQYDDFRTSLTSFIENPLDSASFFNFMEKTSDLGGNPVLMPVMSLPPTGQVLGRAVSVADLVTATRKGDPLGIGMAAWGLLSGTKTGDLIEGRVKDAAGSVKNQISKSKLGQDLAAAAKEKFKKINMLPCPSCKGCIDAGTPILTPSGYQPIESLQIGDTVIAYDTAAGETVERKVTHLHRDITIEWYDIKVGADTLTVTDNHPFWLPETGEWIQARELEIGTVLHPQDGRAARISQITVRQLRQSEPIYNVEIEGDHNYFAGEGAVLVHNGGGGDCRAGLPCRIQSLTTIPKRYTPYRYTGTATKSFHGNQFVNPIDAFKTGIPTKGKNELISTRTNIADSGFIYSSTDPKVAAKFAGANEGSKGFIYEIANPQKSVDVKKAFPNSSAIETGELARYGTVRPEDIIGVKIRINGKWLSYTKDKFLSLSEKQQKLLIAASK